MVLFWIVGFGTDVLTFVLDPQFAAVGVPWSHFSFKQGMTALFWIATSFVALRWLATRPLLARGVARGLLRGAGLALLVCLAYAMYFVLLLNVVTAGQVSWERTFEILISHTLLYGYVTACEIGVAANAFHYYTRTATAQREGERLRLRLAEAEVALLRAQLEPHFLFNALNSISSLIRLERPDRAIEALSQLAALLRAMLEVGQQTQVTWQWERRFTSLYVELQQLRFGSRLAVSIDAVELADDTAVPVFLLQSLIENAIRHGPLEDARRCDIEVRLRRQDGRVFVTVANQLAKQPRPSGLGVGLTNLTARVRALHGEAGELRAAPQGERYVVAVEFPEARL